MRKALTALLAAATLASWTSVVGASSGQASGSACVPILYVPDPEYPLVTHYGCGHATYQYQVIDCGDYCRVDTRATLVLQPATCGSVSIPWSAYYGGDPIVRTACCPVKWPDGGPLETWKYSCHVIHDRPFALTSDWTYWSELCVWPVLGDPGNKECTWVEMPIDIP